MGTGKLNRLSAKTVANIRKPGYYCDGGGLYLQVAPSGTKSWIFRYKSPVTKKSRDMGLGAVHTVNLADARLRATDHRKGLLIGLDPIAERAREKARSAMEAARSLTFSQCATTYIDSHEAAWRNAKHGQQWRNTIETYCGPQIGRLSVADVDTRGVLRVLEPIWTVKPETATRVRSRIECILDWARARGYRQGENPARWRGHLNQLLPTLSKKARVKHHTAMPYSEVSTFIASLQQRSGVAARCLEFTILTATRTGEAINARRDEFDLEQGIWTIPACRMKAGREHRIPLSNRAVAIVRETSTDDNDFVFPGDAKSRPLSNMAMLNLLDRMAIAVTVHGFRSSFRDWAAERTAFSHEVCEMALAHTIPSAAEAAYRRGDLFEKRRRLMGAWSDFLSYPRAPGEVVPLREAA